MNSETLKFLSRDLTGSEVLSCEKIAQKFIESDNYEIEIHNLNEVNEVFSIFKDKILTLQNQLSSQSQRTSQLANENSKPSSMRGSLVSEIKQHHERVETSSPLFVELSENDIGRSRMGC